MKSLFITLLMIFTLTTFTQGQGLNVGDKVPSFEALTDEGSNWNLNENLGKDYLVVYFYPAAMTGGCTAQACAYRDLNNNLEAKNAKVVGVSGDKPENLKFFKKAHNLNFTLLSDPKGDIAKKFGVPLRDGGTYKGEFNGENFELSRDVTTNRWTFIIDKEGKIVYKNDKVDAAKDSEQVLSFLEKNS